jgi:hypothetical protein
MVERRQIMRIGLLFVFVIAMCLPFLGGCEAGSVVGSAIVDSAADSTSELDNEYGSSTSRHAVQRRIRCGMCGGDGIVAEDEATVGNPVGRCKVCDGKGYTLEF